MLEKNPAYVHEIRVVWQQMRSRSGVQWSYRIVNPPMSRSAAKKGKRAVPSWRVEGALRCLRKQLYRSKKVSYVGIKRKEMFVSMRKGAKHTHIHGIIEKTLKRRLSTHCASIYICRYKPGMHHL